jgi:bacterioferritin
LATTHQPFLSDIKEIRRRAREHIEAGAVTPNYGGDLKASVQLLNDALATEIVCFLRYTFHYVTAVGISSEGVKTEFGEHAREEQQHAMQIAERINQLGGKPNFNPDGLKSRSHADYVEGNDLVDMIKENLIAERIAIETYREMVRFFGEKDPVSRRLMEEILAKEEEHANDMHDLLIAHQGRPMLNS